MTNLCFRLAIVCSLVLVVEFREFGEATPAAAADPLVPAETFEIPKTRTINGLVSDGKQLWVSTIFNGGYRLFKVSPHGKVEETYNISNVGNIVGGLAHDDGTLFWLDTRFRPAKGAPIGNGRIWIRNGDGTLAPFVNLPPNQEDQRGLTFHQGAIHYAESAGMKGPSIVYKIVDGRPTRLGEFGEAVRSLTSDGTSLWCASAGALVRLDGQLKPVEKIPLSFEPHAIAWIGRDVWVSQLGGNKLHRIAAVPAPTLVGTWIVRSVEQVGKSAKSGGPAAADKFILHEEDYRISGSMRADGKLRTSSAKEPATIDLLSAQRNQSLFGIYRLDGDRLTLCLASGTRPTKFEPSVKAVLIELDRQP